MSHNTVAAANSKSAKCDTSNAASNNKIWKEYIIDLGAMKEAHFKIKRNNSNSTFN